MRPLLFTIWLSLAAVPLAGQTADDRTRILTVLQQQADGWNNGDIPAYMKGYAQSDSLRFASGGKVSYGWTATLERYRKGYPTRERMGTLTFTDLSVEFLGPQSAMVFGTWRLKRSADEPWGLFTLIFRNIGGEWRIVHDHTSSGN
ncbi:MAG: nuclear transport factor 2 family protein [Bacteroidetes bacterium]|nr:nuclear transport factor 2 family protein [Bacteroidota bacterium]